MSRLVSSSLPEREEHTVSPDEEGERLDRLVASLTGMSRSAARRAVENGLVAVDGESVAPARKVRGGEMVSAQVPVDPGVEAEDIHVPVIFEDEHVIVVDKPAGLVVHPAAGHPSGTLVNALLSRGISGGQDPARPGVVHRLDRDTSGLLALAKSEEAYTGLVSQLSQRRVSRVYWAVVVGGGLPRTGTVDSPVGRHPDNLTLMAAGVGKSAVTHFEVLQTAQTHTRLQVRLETGRTHQIRVHLSAIGHPVYADPLYGRSIENRRLWLHAGELSLAHPVSGEALSFEAPVPEDLRASAEDLGLEA